MTVKLLVVCVLVGVCLANHGNDRVIDQKLSDEPQGSPDYDHEAFLGHLKAEEFKKLHPDESKRRLGVIADKCDEDKNGKITKEELEKWITFTHTRYIKEDSDRQFGFYDKNNDTLIDWDEYKEVSYSSLKDDDETKGSDDQFGYRQMLARDKRRWAVADENGNNILSQEEFQYFIHPEDFERMGDTIVTETLEDIDKNKDGVIDLQEYIGDMYNEEEGGEEPEWVETERHHFENLRDKNKDGKLDLDEVKQWILPQTYVDHAKVEAEHLVRESDANEDGELDRNEIMEHHDVFVGSQATDFGEALARHDEF